MQKTLLSIILMMGYYGLNAQCPSSIQLNVSNNITAACPSSGGVTIGSNAPINTLVYSILSGPSGSSINTPQNDSTFNGLPAGNYIFKATCAIDPTIFGTLPVTVADGYTPISDVTCNIASNCGTFMAGGSITTIITGGKAPLQYSIVANTNPNYPDAQSNYGATNVLNANAFGTYQIRVKDACGQYTTKTVILDAPPPVYFAPYGTALGTLNNQPCDSNKFSTGYNLKNTLTDNTVDKLAYLTPGFKLDIYDGGAGCTQGVKLNASEILVTALDSIILPVSPSKKYYFVLTDACGQVSSHCWNGTSATTMGVVYKLEAFGCGTAGSPATESIWNSDVYFANYPVNFVITNGAGTVVATPTINDGSYHELASNLIPGAYTITATDACGNTATKSTYAQTGAPAAVYTGSNFECVFGIPESEIGTAPATIHFNGGIADMGNAVVKILSGPSQVGITGYKNQDGNYNWMNLLPGSYVFRITTPCGVTDVPYTTNFPKVLSRSITASATSSCSANGTVTGVGIFNGAAVVTYSLLDSNDSILVDAQPGSVFTNLSPGNYKVAMNISYVCSGVRVPTTIISNTVTVTNGTAGPQVVKKFGIVCEDLSGNPLNAGTIYLTLAGAPPMTLQYKKNTDAAWTVHTMNAATTATINNLLPGITYDIQVISCGVSATTHVSLGQLAPLSVSNTLNPCIGASYVLSIPEMPGATYSWANPAGVVVSSSHDYTISNYNASFDGVYTCTVAFNGCVTRVVSTTLNSSLCSLPLPIRVTSFTATNKNCDAILEWNAIYHNTDKAFIVERSFDGKKFTAITTMPVQSANGKYNYTDAINDRNVYYRLKLVDQDGTFIYSPIRIVKACSNGQSNESNFLISPNPAKAGTTASIVYKGTETIGAFTIMNAAGQVIKQSNNIAIQGNVLTISLQGLNAGIYMIRITTTEGKIIGHQKLTVY